MEEISGEKPKMWGPSIVGFGSYRGTVIAAGEGRRGDDGTRIPPEVQAGDQTLFAKYAGTEFKLDDDELLILSQKDILAVIE